MNIDRFKDINSFLNELEERKIFYRLSKTRPESLMVEIEKFICDGSYYDEKELKVLFQDFSD
ncbi:hypothetical protein EUAN_23680 [Andreesenia angusta]|uniref:Uncharacterized protein n=1 Tax=Andreesenia angusta TaxID=39480 RepID=A0A1S1V597_9FIRM|nr:hypothetical protein [Andreesenia angusta]OHW61287.1 hypothetical protein EUAN_23680 [Andreesenia angusta]